MDGPQRVVSRPARVRDSPSPLAQRARSRRRLHDHPPGHQRQHAQRPRHFPTQRLHDSQPRPPAAAGRVGVHLHPDPVSRHRRHGDRRRHDPQHARLSLRRQPPLHLAALDRDDRLRVHRATTCSTCTAGSISRLGRRARGRAATGGPNSGRSTPPRRPARRCKASACWSFTSSACWPACSTSPTACGRWASPGAFGSAPPRKRGHSKSA